MEYLSYVYSNSLSLTPRYVFLVKSTKWNVCRTFRIIYNWKFHRLWKFCLKTVRVTPNSASQLVSQSSFQGTCLRGPTHTINQKFPQWRVKLRAKFNVAQSLGPPQRHGARNNNHGTNQHSRIRQFLADGRFENRLLEIVRHHLFDFGQNILRAYPYVHSRLIIHYPRAQNSQKIYGHVNKLDIIWLDIPDE